MICIFVFLVSIYIFVNRLNDVMNVDVYYFFVNELCMWYFFCVNLKYLYVNYYVIMYVFIVLGICRVYMNNFMNWIYVCDVVYCINL